MACASVSVLAPADASVPAATAGAAAADALAPPPAGRAVGPALAQPAKGNRAHANTARRDGAQQLLTLLREGLVRHEAPAAGAAGRPANLYRLSAEGERLFPRKYDDLLLLIVDCIREELGEEALTRLLTKLTDVRVANLEPAMQ